MCVHVCVCERVCVRESVCECVCVCVCVCVEGMCADVYGCVREGHVCGCICVLLQSSNMVVAGIQPNTD